MRHRQQHFSTWTSPNNQHPLLALIRLYYLEVQQDRAHRDTNHAPAARYWNVCDSSMLGSCWTNSMKLLGSWRRVFVDFFCANHEGVISVQTPTEIYNRQPAQNETTKVQENGLAIWGKIVWSWTLVVAVAWWEHCVVRWTFCVCFFDTKSWQLDWISLAWTGLASVGSSSGKSNIETGEGDYITLANCVIWGKIKLNGVFV